MHALQVTRNVIIVIDVLIFAAFIFSFYQGWKMRPDFKKGVHHEKHPKKVLAVRDLIFQDRWNAVIKKSQSGSPDSLRLALIEADKIADDVLKRLGLPGEHMADRLDELEREDMHSLEGLWRAHRLRNDIVHTPGFQVTLEEVQRALKLYEAFLKEVEVL